MFLTIKLQTTFAKNTSSHHLCITMKIKALCQRTNYPLNEIFANDLLFFMKTHICEAHLSQKSY